MTTPGKLKKLPCTISINDPISSSSESELVEDDDELGVNFSGQLTFNDGLGLDGMGIPGDSDLGDDEGDDGLNDDGDDDDHGDDDTGSHGASFSSLPSGRNFKIYGVSELCPYGNEEKTLSSSKPAFSVTSAKTMKDGHKKFVLYTIAINRNIGSDTSQATIEKRYSDFLDLHKQLTKLFPQVMEHIYFPRKAFTGNFRHQFIAERSRAFEQYLSHIYTSEDIRLSMPYQDFFYATDIRRAYKFMSEGKFQEAIPLLQNASHLQAKLLGEEYPDTVVTFCALVVAYMSIEEGEAHALGYAEAAFRIIREAQTSPFKIPLIQTLIGVRWRLNKEKRDLETLLATYVRPGIGPVDMPTLEDLVMQSLSHV